jgi:condensin complex subunit 2
LAYILIVFSLHIDAGKDPELQTKAPEKKKQKNEKFSIDFLSPSNVDMSILAPAADLKSLMLPQNSSLPSPFLPDDCHYQSENLVRLFLQPSTMVISKCFVRATSISTI